MEEKEEENSTTAPLAEFNKGLPPFFFFHISTFPSSSCGVFVGYTRNLDSLATRGRFQLSSSQNNDNGNSNYAVVSDESTTDPSW